MPTPTLPSYIQLLRYMRAKRVCIKHFFFLCIILKLRVQYNTSVGDRVRSGLFACFTSGVSLADAFFFSSFFLLFFLFIFLMCWSFFNLALLFSAFLFRSYLYVPAYIALRVFWISKVIGLYKKKSILSYT